MRRILVDRSVRWVFVVIEPLVPRCQAADQSGLLSIRSCVEKVANGARRHRMFEDQSRDVRSMLALKSVGRGFAEERRTVIRPVVKDSGYTGGDCLRSWI